MTRTQLSAIAIAFSTLFAGQAMAANDAPVTRAQVQAELAEAIRSGNVIINESGERLNEAFPHNYSAEVASTVSREQVRAELSEAIRNGDILVNESGERLNEAFPNNFAQRSTEQKTRDEVRMELADAIASGLLNRHVPA